MFEISANVKAGQTSAICQDGKIVPFNEGCVAPLLSYVNIMTGVQYSTLSVYRLLEQW